MSSETLRCITNHEALKDFINISHPSGKLAQWGLALQELDLLETRKEKYEC